MKVGNFRTFGVVAAIFAVVFIGCPASDNGTETAHVHQWGDWQVTTLATCTAAGEETRVCALDASHKETQAIAINPTAHQWGAWTETKAATYTEKGEDTRICALDATHKETRPIPRIPFTSVANLETWLTSQPANTAASAYRVELNVNDISNIRTILNNAPNKYVYLDLSGSTITTIPERFFSGEADPLGCATLVGITIPNGVIDIGELAFSGCTSLTSVIIPDSVISIGERAFISCFSLIEINVEADNNAYTAENGVLYTKDKTALHTYPVGKTDTSFTIPDSVTSIGGRAFYNCTSLTSITIPNSVINIELAAFGRCTNLISVTIPNNVTSVRTSLLTSTLWYSLLL
jgi:hypothetical protein